MADYFVESSALAKRYVAETGSSWFTGYFECTYWLFRTYHPRHVGGDHCRYHQAGAGPIAGGGGRGAARTAFRADLAAEYHVVEVTALLATRAMALAEVHGLRGYDAIQLAAALEVNARYVAGGLSALMLVCADTELNAAATAEGLIVDDPNTHV